ncbi:MAG: isoprenylcysteine carboxylmethyltransferase family protein [Rhodanobacteraceae bacterium]|nr:MAG: isoprenylcysteine carboxylmethyltransferase family protein [Rhodanobacteraceae bacterium]
MRHDPITLVWAAWFLYWAAASLRVKPAVRTESAASRLAHWVPMLVGALLLIVQRPHGWLGGWVFPLTFQPRYDTGLALVVAGLAFAVWARIHLGGNWSGSVAVKNAHELIRTGPYRWVRHPIYTGMLCAILGTAIAQNQWRSWLALGLIWLALWRKWRLEERFMQATFGERYQAYRARVPAIIPWKWPR